MTSPFFLFRFHARAALRASACAWVFSLLSGMLMAVAPARVFAQGVLAGPTPPGPLNSMAAAVDRIGAAQCRSQLTTLSALGIQGASANDLLLDWDHRRAKSSPVFSLIGLDYPSNAAAMSVTAVPETDGSCSVSAERISVEPLGCKAVAGRELKGYRATPLLGHMTVYTEGKDAGSSVSLIDSPPGCLVIRRYVVFSEAASH